MPKEYIINLDTMITIRKELLSEKIAYLGINKISEINNAIKLALGS